MVVRVGDALVLNCVYLHNFIVILVKTMECTKSYFYSAFNFPNLVHVLAKAPTPKVGRLGKMGCFGL